VKSFTPPAGRPGPARPRPGQPGSSQPGPGEPEPGEPEPGEPGAGGAPAPLRVLILEDDPADAHLEQRLLRKAGLEFIARVAATKTRFIRELDTFGPHVILSDFSLPGFSGQQALAIARASSPHIPFIVLSGTIEDEAAVSLIKQGATDYVLKDRPQRLASAVHRAVAEAALAAQRSRLEAQLEQAGRLESLGQLAGGVAHDFNNLLTVISSHAAFAAHEAAKDPAEISWPGLREDIEQIGQAVDRAARLTRQLLAFGRREVTQPRLLEVNRVVRGVTEMLASTLGESIELVTRLADDLGPVLADPGQLERVLVNLAVNARDAMPGGGRLTISTAATALAEADAAASPGLHPGRYVSLEVSDTGTGIPPEVVHRVFEPFFSTKPPGEGTGLGLATVYGTVSQAGGTVRIGPGPAGGTTVTVLLPVSTVTAGSG
jgi:signal transduction histidine kinase